MNKSVKLSKIGGRVSPEPLLPEKNPDLKNPYKYKSSSYHSDSLIRKTLKMSH